MMTLDLPPETEERLRAAASERGMDLAEFIRQWVNETLPPINGDWEESGERPLTPEEKIELLNAMAEEHRGAPILPPEAFNRENIYAEEKIRALDELAERNRDVPPLPPEAFDREWIYADEEEIIRHIQAKREASSNS